MSTIETTLPGKVRVRFAPSPTGTAESSLHMGVARTAVFNWLFARGRAGRFILRIEDTDAERSSAASERAIMESLAWLGLDWDEGPDIGGPAGPYRQSERLDRYREAAARLVAEGKAYPCFCAEERLEAARERARAEGRSPRYDGSCARLDPATAAARAAREPRAIRFRVAERAVTVRDALRGDVTFQAGTLGDFVLLRASGLPVYNFACVVDDAAMAITHVLRGEDHLANTQRQLLLYEALGAAPPVFAHLSMILGEDRTKLAKRHGAVSVEQYRAQGYPPEAIVNYLALLGWNPGDGREAMTREELIAAFTIEHLNKAGAVFDAAKLDWLAGLKIRHAGPEALLPAARAFLPDEDDARRLLEIRAVIDHLRCAADLPRELALLRGPASAPDDEAQPWLSNAALFAALAELLVAPGGGPAARETVGGELTAEEFKAALTAAGKQVGVKGRELFMPVRAALTGRTHGPELPAVAAILGREQVLARLRAFISP
ncbi:glutamate--tRNA ligase [bacterium]|nr:glutamate--tRNA ligase [bacterium]